MEREYYNLTDLLKLFPGLKPSLVDYLVREGHVTSCIRSGKGRPRRFSEQAIDEIRAYLRKSESRETG